MTGSQAPTLDAAENTALAEVESPSRALTTALAAAANMRTSTTRDRASADVAALSAPRASPRQARTRARVAICSASHDGYVCSTVESEVIWSAESSLPVCSESLARSACALIR